MNHLKGEITLFSKWRSSPMKEGYKPMFRILGKGGSLCISEMEKEELLPGESTKGKIEFLNIEYVVSILKEEGREFQPGQYFFLREGPYVVGKFKVEEVLNLGNGRKNP